MVAGWKNKQKMKRLFVFGCSFTKYEWPTWADFISCGVDEYYNIAQKGSGNQCIFENLINADITYNFTQHDTVLVMWSSYQRHDFFKNGTWHTQGNVLNAPDVFDEDYLDKFFDIKGSIMHSLNYIYAAQHLLANRCKWNMASMVDLTDPVGEVHMAERILSLFRSNDLFHDLPEFEKYRSVLTHSNWAFMALHKFAERYDEHQFRKTIYSSGVTGMDSHPTPAMHLDWLIATGFQFDEKRARELLSAWNEKFGTGIVDAQISEKWCKNNIPHVKR